MSDAFHLPISLPPPFVRNGVAVTLPLLPHETLQLTLTGIAHGSSAIASFLGLLRAISARSAAVHVFATHVAWAVMQVIHRETVYEPIFKPASPVPVEALVGLHVVIATIALLVFLLAPSSNVAATTATKKKKPE